MPVGHSREVTDLREFLDKLPMRPCIDAPHPRFCSVCERLNGPVHKRCLQKGTGSRKPATFTLAPTATPRAEESAEDIGALVKGREPAIEAQGEMLEFTTVTEPIEEIHETPRSAEIVFKSVKEPVAAPTPGPRPTPRPRPVPKVAARPEPAQAPAPKPVPKPVKKFKPKPRPIPAPEDPKDPGQREDFFMATLEDLHQQVEEHEKAQAEAQPEPAPQAPAPEPIVKPMAPERPTPRPRPVMKKMEPTPQPPAPAPFEAKAQEPPKPRPRPVMKKREPEPAAPTPATRPLPRPMLRVKEEPATPGPAAAFETDKELESLELPAVESGIEEKPAPPLPMKTVPKRAEQPKPRRTLLPKKKKGPQQMIAMVPNKGEEPTPQGPPKDGEAGVIHATPKPVPDHSKGDEWISMKPKSKEQLLMQTPGAKPRRKLKPKKK